MATQGIFITFEGIDGCGKTTQLRVLSNRLRKLGRHVIETIEPGGTDIGRQIRSVLLDARNHNLKPRAELLLYFASRAQNVEQVIRPGLERGSVILCDRFTDSTLVYQGCGRGLGAETVLELDHIACNGLRPDLTILVDIDLETSLARARNRNRRTGTTQTRMDEQSIAFYESVRRGYFDLAAKEPGRFRVIDGHAHIDVVSQRIWDAVAARLDIGTPPREIPLQGPDLNDQAVVGHQEPFRE